MKIYTKKGDTGFTTLLDGNKIPKNSIILECLGDLDELNSEIGYLISITLHNAKEIKYDEIIFNIIRQVQLHLFEIGTIITCYENANEVLINTLKDIDEQYTKLLELSIDTMTTKMPKLKHFILPGGNLIQSLAHKTRTICRRLERKIIHCINNNYKINIICIAYINRLSDFLFTYARYIGHINGINDVVLAKV